ncbi:GNAT family N-acetyltransferase [Flavimaricola marinus]|uniref:Putative acetyltransferase n=1 Tax=Flavimaricola marinus TaxID=1819565 RepID=A0A238LBA7_9RHOB|nr:GNAT family N-acetyltransferase [Flavimaricola marinus]SMY06843.1 putative acetyltransferase [Flavimaricola marinus]
MRISPGFEAHERPRIAELYWDAFGQKLGRTLGPRHKALNFIVRVLSPDYAICARGNDGRLLGVVGFKTMDGALVDGDFSDMAAVYGWIGAAWRVLLLTAMERDVENTRFLMDGIFVDPAARGQGVGSRLLEAVAQEAAARGYSELRLDVIDSNGRARALYERRGFAAIGEMSTGWMRHVFGFRSSTTMVRRLD